MYCESSRNAFVISRRLIVAGPISRGFWHFKTICEMNTDI